MAVSLDAAGTHGGTTTATLVTTFNWTGLTVGASGSNKAILMLCGINNGNGAGSRPTGVTATWDSGGANQAMTLITSFLDPTNGDWIFAFGLLNPTTGNKTLNVSWTNGSSIGISGLSLNGVLQSSVAAAFGSATNSGSATTATVSISSSASEFCAAIMQSFNSFSSPSDTVILDTPTGGEFIWNSNLFAEYGVGAATKTMTVFIAGPAAYSAIAIAVRQATAAGPTPYNPWPQMAPIMAQ